MSDKPDKSSDRVNGQYDEYSDLLLDLKRSQKQTPVGVGIKLERGNSLSLQFINPDTGKRTCRGCGCSLTRRGILDALDKAYMVSEALKRFTSSSEFWDWYSENIAANKSSITNDRKTYKQIFEEIKDRFFNGYHRNTGRKREIDKTKPGSVSDWASFNRTYEVVFNRFTDWTKYPSWEEINEVWNSFTSGTKSYKDVKTVMLAIAELTPNNSKLLKQIKSVNASQSVFKNKQSIDLDTFLNWYKETYKSIELIDREDFKHAKQAWLWVASMCVLYGLRPSEIAASLNLDKPYTKDGITIYALNDSEKNPNATLVIGEFTYFGTSTKTGLRVVNPVPMPNLMDELKIKNPLLPVYKPRSNSKPDSVLVGFDNQFSCRMKNYNCPVSQKYAFRHLYNQLLEMCGVSTTIRSRLMGHSETTNSGTYKKRRNLKTELAIINSTANKQPLPLDAAMSQLTLVGINVEDPSIKAVLNIVYQLD